MKNTFISLATIPPEDIYTKQAKLHANMDRIITKNKLVKVWSDKPKKYCMEHGAGTSHLVIIIIHVNFIMVRTPNCDMTAF